ncbi:hypothetical protein GCM10009664_63530 [Kitasatospora gansuensis]
MLFGGRPRAERPACWSAAHPADAIRRPVTRRAGHSGCRFVTGGEDQGVVDRDQRAALGPAQQLPAGGLHYAVAHHAGQPVPLLEVDVALSGRVDSVHHRGHRARQMPQAPTETEARLVAVVGRVGAVQDAVGQHPQLLHHPGPGRGCRLQRGPLLR